MAPEADVWRPGSFTKNYSWGPSGSGLRQLHEAIRVGFDGKIENVRRDDFRSRIAPLGRPDYIPINFFLYNTTLSGVDWIVADELVFQAVTFGHSKRFDNLALFAFNLSMVGTWKGAKTYQSRPALWAHHYVADRLGRELQWDGRRATANDIQTFVAGSPLYTGEGSRKLSTNLAYLYAQAGLDHLKSKKVDRWWIDALFLTLDRVLMSRRSGALPIVEDNYDTYLVGSRFHEVAGSRSVEKDLASKHLLRLYKACGGTGRFDDEAVRARTDVLLNEVANYVANNNDPIGAIHPSNVRVLKSLPKVCALLARFAGFEVLDLGDLENMDTSDLARGNILRALASLQERGIKPSINSEELMKLLRGE